MGTTGRAEARLDRVEAAVCARRERAAAPKLSDHRHGLLVAGYLAEVGAVSNPADDRSQLAVLKAGCLLTGDRSCLPEIIRAEAAAGLPDDAFWSAVGGKPLHNGQADLSRMKTAEEAGCPAEWWAAMAELGQRFGID